MLNAVIKVCLRQYWVPPADEVIEAIEMEDWTDALEAWPVNEVRRVLQDWVRTHPRRRPNHGDIFAILMKRRGNELRTKDAHERAALEQAKRAFERQLGPDPLVLRMRGESRVLSGPACDVLLLE